MGPGNKEVTLGVNLLTIIINNSLVVFLHPVIETLSCVGLEVSFSKGRNAPTKAHNNSSIESEDETAMWPFLATYVTEPMNR